MDIEKIKRDRANRESREARPFKNFIETAYPCLKAGQAIVEERESSEHRNLIARSVVITTVTAIEVYFRDILELLFKYCDPEFFEPQLKKLHPNKYDITDLIKAYRHNIHPLELVVSEMSFQNAEQIEKTFSNFFEDGFWGRIFDLQVRVKDQPNSGTSFGSEDLDGLKRIFKLRHELVHNPGQQNFLTEKALSDLNCAIGIIVGADIVLSQMLEKNKDPSL